MPGTNHNGEPETEPKQNGNTEGENGTLSEDRKRKHDDTPINGEHSGDDIKKESNGKTDVNGNEGPDAKKKKLGYIENGHKNEMVKKESSTILEVIWLHIHSPYILLAIPQSFVV